MLLLLSAECVSLLFGKSTMEKKVVPFVSFDFEQVELCRNKKPPSSLTNLSSGVIGNEVNVVKTLLIGSFTSISRWWRGEISWTTFKIAGFPFLNSRLPFDSWTSCSALDRSAISETLLRNLLFIFGLWSSNKCWRGLLDRAARWCCSPNDRLQGWVWESDPASRAANGFGEDLKTNSIQMVFW